MAQNNTQNITTRRNAVAILAVVPLAAAISVSPAPLSNVEKLEARLVVMRRNGLVRMCVSWCPIGATMAAEGRAVCSWLPWTRRGPGGMHRRPRVRLTKFAQKRPAPGTRWTVGGTPYPDYIQRKESGRDRIQDLR
jgi:hypothetical protein